MVEGAFGHRRKTLANSLALAGLASREQAVAALAAIGRDAAVRAEALAPDEFVAARGGFDRVLTGVAPAKLNLALVVGALQPEGKHEVVTVVDQLALADTLTVDASRRAPCGRLCGRHARALVR